MKQILLVLAVFSGSFLGSCQCSNPPDVPPVEKEAKTTTVTAKNDAADLSDSVDGPASSIEMLESGA